MSAEIAQDLERLIHSWSSSGDNHGTAKAAGIQSVDLYRIGTVLHVLTTTAAAAAAAAAATSSSPRGQDNDALIESVKTSYHQLLSKLPVSFRQELFHNLLQGLQQLLQTVEVDQEEDVILPALCSLSALYQASTLTDASSTKTRDCIHFLALQYSKLKLDQRQRANSSSFPTNSLPRALLTLLALLLMSLSSHTTQDHDMEPLLAVINTLQEEDAWSDLVQHLNTHHLGWKEDILQHADSSQQDYLRSFLDNNNNTNSDHSTGHGQGDNVTWNHPELKAANRPKKETARISDPVQDRIDQVRAILPDLGEGFVETALSLYQGNVEQTVSALLLLDSQDPEVTRNLPAQLLIVDRSLPRRKTQTARQVAQEEADAKLVAKAVIQAAQRQEQEEAALVNKAMQNLSFVDDDNTQQSTGKQGRVVDEYNDDYDDQWDNDSGDLAIGDSGLYDDYQAVKTYNRVYREMEADDKFWQENRNTNRGGGPVTTTTTKEANQFRGPDKLRGGRVPTPSGGGRGRGRGRGGRGNNSKKAPPAAAGEKGPDNSASASANTSKNDSNESGSGNQTNPRRKERALAKRREQQKKAMYKKTG